MSASSMQFAMILATATYVVSCGQANDEPPHEPRQTVLESSSKVQAGEPTKADEPERALEPGPALGSPVPTLARRQQSGELSSFLARVSYYGPAAGRRPMPGRPAAPMFAVKLEITSPPDLAGRTIHLNSPQDLPPGDPLRVVGARYRLVLTDMFVQSLSEAEEGHTIYPGVGSVRVLGPAAE